MKLKPLFLTVLFSSLIIPNHARGLFSVKNNSTYGENILLFLTGFAASIIEKRTLKGFDEAIKKNPSYIPQLAYKTSQKTIKDFFVDKLPKPGYQLTTSNLMLESGLLIGKRLLTTDIKITRNNKFKIMELKKNENGTEYFGPYEFSIKDAAINFIKGLAVGSIDKLGYIFKKISPDSSLGDKLFNLIILTSLEVFKDLKEVKPVDSVTSDFGRMLGKLSSPIPTDWKNSFRLY